MRSDSCRLQLLQGVTSGRRIAVLTQVVGGEAGGGMANNAELFTRALKSSYFVDEDGWPPFVEHFVRTADERRWGSMLLVRFSDPGPAGGEPTPSWEGLPRATREVVERCAAPGRGAGYVPPPPRVPDGADWWVDAAVSDLPATNCFRAACLRPDGHRLHRLVRRLGVRRCRCWYHEGSWARAVDAAFDALRCAHAESRMSPVGARAAADAEALFEAVVARATDLLHEAGGHRGSWVTQAAASLIEDPVVISPNDLVPRPAGDRPRSYVNGQHRVQAMKDQRVQRVPVAVWLAGTANPPAHVQLLASEPPVPGTHGAPDASF